MYQLTARMEQSFEQYLTKYHELFSGGRCSGWELEELILKAIQSDNNAQHHPVWREAGHDDKADITVQVNTQKHALQIKSGKLQKGHLILSGHRLGRFNGDLLLITTYLNNINVEIISVPYQKVDDTDGRHHSYQIVYFSAEILKDLAENTWYEHGKVLKQINRHGVELSLRPSMSWQVWWKIPEELLVKGKSITVG